ncbi:MAG: helix-turn-helix transcriptional regulator [Lachnospiraceae bacterium]|nr:helix-turn-helix transcriptional regulator [Lachnospiraceae bacterium]
MTVPVGERIREARHRQGLSQAVLADKLGIDQSEISRIESGERQVKDTNKQALADILDENIMNLFF